MVSAQLLILRNYLSKKLQSCRSQVGSVWLFGREAWVHIPGQASKRNMEKYIFLWRFHFSRFLGNKSESK